MISQEEYSPEDPANPCVNYPTEEYESYADCDDHYVRSFLPPGLKPFWTVDNTSDATNIFDVDYEIFSKLVLHLGDLFTGLASSDCLLPCLQTKATVKETESSSLRSVTVL